MRSQDKELDKEKDKLEFEVVKYQKMVESLESQIEEYQEAHQAEQKEFLNSRIQEQEYKQKLEINRLKRKVSHYTRFKCSNFASLKLCSRRTRHLMGFLEFNRTMWGILWILLRF